MEKQKTDWGKIIGIIGIVVLVAISQIFGKEQKKVEYEKFQFVVVSRTSDEDNTCKEIVYDTEKKVMYEIENGVIKTPLFNVDGTPKTYKPE